jgi:hypothetical protein
MCSRKIHTHAQIERIWKENPELFPSLCWHSSLQDASSRQPFLPTILLESFLVTRGDTYSITPIALLLLLCKN